MKFTINVHVARFFIFLLAFTAIAYGGIFIAANYATFLPLYGAAITSAIFTYLFKIFEG